MEGREHRNRRSGALTKQLFAINERKDLRKPFGYQYKTTRVLFKLMYTFDNRLSLFVAIKDDIT
jgi:hypothetical protein